MLQIEIFRKLAEKLRISAAVMFFFFLSRASDELTNEYVFQRICRQIRQTSVNQFGWLPSGQSLGGIDVCAAASKRRLSSRWPPLPPPPRASNPLFRAESASRFCRLPYAAPRLGSKMAIASSSSSDMMNWYISHELMNFFLTKFQRISRRICRKFQLHFMNHWMNHIREFILINGFLW